MTGRAGLPSRGEAGSGLVSSWIGFVVFLMVLLFGVQVLFNLYATSAVSAVAYDAATLAARGGGGSAARSAAEDHARQLLGGYAGRASFDWSASDGDHVALRVQVSNPSIVPAVLGDGLGFAQIDRTVQVRVEAFR